VKEDWKSTWISYY